jgi:protein ImuB
MKRVLCVWLPSWPLQRVCDARPELRGKAVLIYEPQGSRGSRVVIASRLAAQWGIAPGMPLAEAVALVPREPKAESRKPKFEIQDPKSKIQNPKSEIAASAAAVGRMVGRAKADSNSLRGSRARPTAHADDRDRTSRRDERSTGADDRDRTSRRDERSTGADDRDRTSGGGGSRDREDASHDGSHRAHAPLPNSISAASTDSTTSTTDDTPAFELIVHDPLADRAALEKLAEWCERFSPIVGLEESDSPECLLADVTGCARLFQGEEALAEHVAHEFSRRGLVVRVAIADTIGAAWSCAHGRFHATGTRTTVVPAGRAAEFLAPLPVATLRLPAETVGTLFELGITRIGELDRLPRASLVSRFGPRLVERLDQTLGRAPELLVPYRPPPAVQAGWPFEFPTDRWETIEWVVRELVERVAGVLSKRSQGALQLECGLFRELAEPVKVSIGLFRPSASARHLWELLRLQLEQCRLAGLVCGVRVQVQAASPLVQPQPKLFETGPSRDGDDSLAGLIDRLSSRLGRESVVRARLVPDAQPEQAFVYEPWIQPATGAKRSRPVRRHRAASSPNPAPSGAVPPLPASARGGGLGVRGLAAAEPAAPEVPPPDAISPLPASARGAGLEVRGAAMVGNPRRPLRLWARPVAVTVFSLVPDGPPVRFYWAGQDRPIVHAWGPERIETGWWRGQPARRDYYQVETTSGARFWLFRRLRDGQWFVHGCFD